MAKKLFIVFSVLILLVSTLSLFFSKKPIVFAQTVTPAPTADASSATSNIQECSDNHISVADCPAYLQNRINQLAGQAQTLDSQIVVMDSQIQLTQARIYATEQQISDLTLSIDTANQKINSIQSSLASLTNILLNKVVATYEVGAIQPMQILLTSTTATDFLQRLNYLRIAQAHDKKLLYDTGQARNDYQNQKNIYEDQKRQIEALKAQLEVYTSDLNNQKAAKQQLLTQTQGDEATYQRLLSAAQAQLAGFSRFVTAQGGASILTNQTVCDSWGCYYNQRDSQWGNIGINNTSTSIAEAGCLMTSMAMVITHYGHKVTPLDINSSQNFFSTTAYLLFTISAGGVSATRVSAAIDPVLAGGDPVIVGISYDGGPLADHFVVLRSGSNGNYMMNDPFTPNGNDIPFTSHYSLGSIVEVERVNI